MAEATAAVATKAATAAVKAGATNSKLAKAVDDDFDDDDFEVVGLPDVDGWFKPAIGAAFKGKVVGRIQIENDDGKLRDVCLVELEKACEGAVVVDGEEGKSLEAGQILGVGVRAKLTDMLFYIEKKGRVMVKALSEQKLRGKKTMWVFDVRGEKGKRSEKIPPATPRLQSEDTSI